MLPAPSPPPQKMHRADARLRVVSAAIGRSTRLPSARPEAAPQKYRRRVHVTHDMLEFALPLSVEIGHQRGPARIRGGGFQPREKANLPGAPARLVKPLEMAQVMEGKRQ